MPITLRVQMGASARKRRGRPVDPPDGGWGWMVALTGFVVCACSYGVMRSLGVFFVTWQDYFSVSAAQTGLIQSIITGVLNLAAPIAGALSNRFGCRVVVMAGGVISSAGFVLSLWATSLFHLYITVGFLTGFGYSLSLITTMATIGRYFTTHRLRANSFASIGNSIVSFAFPPLFQYLMDEYTWRGALLLIGGIVLQVAGFGALVRPIFLKSDVTPKCDDRTDDVIIEQSSTNDEKPLENTATRSTHYPLSRTIMNKISSVLDLSLLTETRFVLFCLAVFLFGFSRFVPNIYLVPRARAFGVKEYPSAFLLSILAIGDIIGRASVVLLPEWPRFRRVDQFAINIFLMGVVTLFAPLAKTYVTMAVYSACYGLLMGGCVPLLYSAIAEIGGANKMSSSLSIAMFIRGIGNLAGPPFSGWLRDLSGSFDATLLEGGGCLVLAGLLLLLLHLRVFQRTETEENIVEPETDHLLTDGKVQTETESIQTHQTLTIFRETAYKTTHALPISKIRTVGKYISTSPVWRGREQDVSSCYVWTVAISTMGTLCHGRKPGRPVNPPDGGWGWMVALAGFVVSACSYGVMRSVGVFFVTWQDYFSMTAAETGLIQSIITGVLNLAAPIAGALSNRFGCRVVVMAGGVISSAGFVLSLWASSLFHLYVTVGFLTGFGYSLSLTTTMATIGRYFTTHRLRANSFASIGGSFASFAFPPLFQYLMDEYTWRGALVLIGGIVLQVAAFGALVRPILLKSDVTTNKTPGKVQESSGQSSKLSENITNVHLTAEKHSLTKIIVDKIGSVIDIRLLTEPRFLLFCVAVFLFGFGRFVPNIYIVPRARAFGVEEYPSAFLLSILAIGDIIGRALVGLLPEWPRFRRADQYAMNIFLMGVVTLFAPLAKTYVTMAVYSACYGLLMGGCVPLLYSAIAEIGGANRMSSALGIIMFLRGAGNLAGPPFSGWLRDITGSFDATLLEGGGCLVLAGLLPFVLLMRVFQPTPTDDKIGEHETDGTGLSLLAAECEESKSASTHSHETTLVIRETTV
ncbi:uncharacterized protein LOC144872061 [Branchiostoma floridae x Branchiostoma japonicum]